MTLSPQGCFNVDFLSDGLLFAGRYDNAGRLPIRGDDERNDSENG